jgi:integrase
MAGKLTARSAATNKPGRYGDGDGLYLIVAASGARKWVFRFTFSGKVTEMGLGAADVVTLAEAREKALAARRMVADGKNPIVERREAAKAQAEKPTFGRVADDLLSAKEAEWKNDKHRAQWRMTLQVYAAPLRSMPVDEIDTEAVLQVLQPIWLEKPETASRLRGRIEAVLDAARVRGFIGANVANPARWKGHLDKLISKPKKLSRGHHAALPYEELPAFLARLRARSATAALALEFCILTAARSGEVRTAKWEEIDFERKVWTVPAER